LASWIDYTVNGIIIGNIYALLAVGLALIFGVSRLINFAHGSVYVVGAYAGFLAVTKLGTPLPVTIVIHGHPLPPTPSGNSYRPAPNTRAATPKATRPSGTHATMTPTKPSRSSSPTAPTKSRRRKKSVNRKP